MRSVDPNSLVWLASYPRSGNTLLRMILHHRLGLKTSSLYDREFEPSSPLSSLVGVDENSSIIKTHSHCYGLCRLGSAIYIERNEQDCMASLDRYYVNLDEQRQSVEPIWGSWRDHVSSWRQRECLWLRFEELKTEETLQRLAEFFNADILDAELPAFSELRTLDSRLFGNEFNVTDAKQIFKVMGAKRA